MSNRFNNPDVCLVRNDAGDIIVFQAGGFQSSVGSGGHGCDRLLIRLFAQHLNGIELLVDVSGSNRATAPAARHEEDIGKLSIAPHVCRDYAVRICAIPQNRCASPVAEKHAGVSIRPVDNRTELIGANYQDRVVDVRRNELLTDFHRVQESRAGSRHVKTGCMDDGTTGSIYDDAGNRANGYANTKRKKDINGVALCVTDALHLKENMTEIERKVDRVRRALVAYGLALKLLGWL